MSSTGSVHTWFTFRLYVAGHTMRSALSIRNLRQFCNEHLAGIFEIEVIDIRQQPALARKAQIVASPTLVKETPLPQQRLIGDLSDEAEVLAGLGISPKHSGGNGSNGLPKTKRKEN